MADVRITETCASKKKKKKIFCAKCVQPKPSKSRRGAGCTRHDEPFSRAATWPRATRSSTNNSDHQRALGGSATAERNREGDVSPGARDGDGRLAPSLPCSKPLRLAPRAFPAAISPPWAERRGPLRVWGEGALGTVSRQRKAGRGFSGQCGVAGRGSVRNTGVCFS